MKADDLYHCGLVVEDFDAEMAFLTDVVGHRWTQAFEVDQTVELDGRVDTIPLRLAFSLTEPRLELVQAVPNTLWTPSTSGLHHLGYWSDDIDDDIAALRENHFAVEGRGLTPEGETLWAYCKGPIGPRIELVNRVMQPVMESFFAMGAADPARVDGDRPMP
ncbi:VOC family protein [Mycobacterium intracellulare]|uniref:VOC family protein n=1 Tax=Mycobacterium intracellulare TaxID=1767 RepID=A0AAE4U274_MYCIT|nr:VOC family protein [Mycobacterium intracellulare]MCA2318604.1 VOC family protein [Mycobacterium intracellulare]MCA2339091.1 VOC family protein [Mycobacterium intracellulare]MDV6975547.1 VOC family protein [Mycobacterium intracellulare]MDV6980611.1 VOC family protein [Mycobacterium intracellulare]MDV7011040.1 VOC family protein [Mycobacterium intracellulare]